MPLRQPLTLEEIVAEIGDGALYEVRHLRESRPPYHLEKTDM